MELDSVVERDRLLTFDDEYSLPFLGAFINKYLGASSPFFDPAPQ